MEYAEIIIENKVNKIIYFTWVQIFWNTNGKEVDLNG